MSLVEIRNIRVTKPKCPLSDPFSFEIEFEATKDIPGELEWVVIFNAVGNNESDQQLDRIVVGPVPKGLNKFTLTTKHAPDTSKVPEDELDSAIVLIRVSYNEKKFAQVGFFVSISKDSEGNFNRDVLASKPRVTTYEIEWEEES